MSFDGTIRLLGPRARVQKGHHESQLAHLQRVAPVSFQLDLGGGGGGGGGGRALPAAIGHNGPHADSDKVTFSIERRLARLLFLSQVLIVFVLGFMVFSLLFFSWRLHSNASWAYDAAQPYIYEFSNHSMEIMRHAHNSSAALENVMVDGQTLSNNAVPALTQSLNNTVAMVDRMQQIAANPVVKVSLGSA
jgi:hypothetical protein